MRTELLQLKSEVKEGRDRGRKGRNAGQFPGKLALGKSSIAKELRNVKKQIRRDIFSLKHTLKRGKQY